MARFFDEGTLTNEEPPPAWLAVAESKIFPSWRPRGRPTSPCTLLDALVGLVPSPPIGRSRR
jgi:hypothetical protein